MQNKVYYLFKEFEWDSIPKVKYKNNGIKEFSANVMRQNFISAASGVDFELRYFECQKDGFTNLEKHKYVYIVIIARGTGKVLIKNKIYHANKFDLFVIPEIVAHQLINMDQEPFGFFCIVNKERDTGRLLNKDEIDELKNNKDICKYIKVPDGYL